MKKSTIQLLATQFVFALLLIAACAQESATLSEDNEIVRADDDLLAESSRNLQLVNPGLQGYQPIQLGKRYPPDYHFDFVPEGGHYTSSEGATYYVRTPPASYTPTRPALYGGRGEHGAPCIGDKDCNNNFVGQKGFRCIQDADIISKLGLSLPSSVFRGVCLWLGEGVDTSRSLDDKDIIVADNSGEPLVNEMVTNPLADLIAMRHLQELNAGVQGYQPIQLGKRFGPDYHFDFVPPGGHYTSPEGATYYVRTPPASYTPSRSALYGGRGEHGAPCIGDKDCNSHFVGNRGFKCIQDFDLIQKLGFSRPAAPFRGTCLWLGEGLTDE